MSKNMNMIRVRESRRVTRSGRILSARTILALALGLSLAVASYCISAPRWMYFVEAVGLVIVLLLIDQWSLSRWRSSNAIIYREHPK